MRAVVIHEFGGSDVLRVETLEDPEPGPGEVTVGVAACAINHVDLDMREGSSRFGSTGQGIDRVGITFPHILGLEVVGRIAEVGPGIEEWHVGDRVMPYLIETCGTCRYCASGREAICMDPGLISFTTSGGYAEKLVCSAARLIELPEGIPDDEAAAIQVAFATSWQLLFTRGQLRAAETVLVNAVGSGIGSAGVQLSQLAGAFVIGTAGSDEKLAHAAELGMDVGINYNKQDVVEEVMRITNGVGVDLVYEHVGGELFHAGVDSLAKDGRLVTCGAHGGEVVEFGIIPFFRSNKAIMGSTMYTREEVKTVVDLAARGRIKPVVHEVFPLERAAEAMDTLAERAQFGKVILKP